jgi:hypothetical protein
MTGALVVGFTSNNHRLALVIDMHHNKAKILRHRSRGFITQIERGANGSGLYFVMQSMMSLAGHAMRMDPKSNEQRA